MTSRSFEQGEFREDHINHKIPPREPKEDSITVLLTRDIHYTVLPCQVVLALHWRGFEMR